MPAALGDASEVSTETDESDTARAGRAAPCRPRAAVAAITNQVSRRAGLSASAVVPGRIAVLFTKDPFFKLNANREPTPGRPPVDVDPANQLPLAPVRARCDPPRPKVWEQV